MLEPELELDVGAGSGAAVGTAIGASVGADDDVLSEVHVAAEVGDRLAEVEDIVLDVVVLVVDDDACELAVVLIGLIQNWRLQNPLSI